MKLKQMIAPNHLWLWGYNPLPLHLGLIDGQTDLRETGREGDGQTDLCIEVVGQVVEELALDGVLLGEQGEVVAQLVVGGDDGSLAVLVELRPAGTAEDLHDVQDAQVHQGAPLGVVDLGALRYRGNERTQ